MNYLKKIIKPILFTLIFVLVSIFIITLLNYFNILSYKITIYLKFILSIIAFLIGGFLIGIKSLKKGWLEGLKYSLIIIIPIIIFNLLYNSFEYKTIILYFIFIFSSVIGSMFGITKKGTS